MGDSDSKRVRKMLEDEHIGDRTPFQFYRDLINLATPCHRMTLSSRSGRADYRYMCNTFWTPWTKRKLTRIADSIHKILPEAGRIVAVSAERTATDSERLNRVLDAMEDALYEDETGVVVDRL